MEGTDVREQSDVTVAPEAAAPMPASEAQDHVSEPTNAAGDGDSPDVEIDGASLMEQFLSDPSHDYKTLKYGDVMDGVIMHIDRDELLVDIGSKSEGIVPAREYSSLTPEEKQSLGIGETVLVFVVQPENQEGHAVVSIDRARQEKSWRRLQELHEANEIIEAEVTNYNKGGLLVNLDGVRGFVPASQVSEIRGGDESSKQADMARLIGTTLPLKVIEINRHRNRLILSERQAIQERRDVMKEKLIEELNEGEIRKGRVSSICDFGAFVDIGGADGLVHLSELSWSRVRHPSEVLKVGNEVDVYVLGINAQEKKIALSIKRTQAEPWSRVSTNYEVGQLVRGTVTQLANFGAFARIEDGIEGLIHVSELADERITHPKQVVQEGQELLLRIIRIDPQRRRMGLSLRRALDTPDAELSAVFGEEILEERDQLVQRIRAALEAEGIEIGSGRAAKEEETSEESAAEAAPPSQPEAEAEPVAEAAPIQVPETSESEVAEPETKPQPRAKASRQQRQQEQEAPQIPVDVDGEPMSAMAMAFAMAGAQTEVDAEEGAEAQPAEAASTTDESAVEAEAAQATAAADDAGGQTDTRTEAEAPEATSDDSESVVDTVSDAVSSAASAVADKVEQVVEAVSPDDADDTKASAESEAETASDESDGKASAKADGGEGTTG